MAYLMTIPDTQPPGKGRFATQDGVSIRAAIWDAAGQIGDEDGAFAVEDLAIRCWKLYPLVFGMPRHEHLYPDMRKISAAVYGAKGSIAAGQLMRREDGLLARGLTPPPAAAIRPRGPNSSLARYDAAIRRLTELQAFKLFATGRKLSILRSTAEHWWDQGGGREKISALLRDRRTPLLREVGAMHDYLSGRFVEDR